MSKAERTNEEIVEEIMAGLYEELLPDPPPKAKPKPALAGDVLPFPPLLSEQELYRRQRVIDATWERVLAERAELEAEDAMGCHVGRGDPDFREGAWRDPLGLWRGRR